MSELEKLRVEVDVLTARSWVLEALVIVLMRRETGTIPAEWDAHNQLAGLRDHLRYSSLSDQQTALFVEEAKAMLQRLQTVGPAASGDALL